ncbi:MAG: restriction endonuclease, partial [Tumebacillaceae bacterium]
HFPEGKRVKVLSLFFIDRVANYTEADGKIRRWFEESYRELARKPRYRKLQLPAVDTVHNGYFATDRKGQAKDTTGRTQADDEAYELIMRDKERLLSRAEPLRFIFSHSALREGWDNPNVFQICTLNETKSDVKKRQEIGRGLRLPVDETGQRLFDHPINRLTVIANEKYEDFVRSLQTEIAEDCGEQFPAPDNKRQRPQIFRIDRGLQNQYFQELWKLLKAKTSFEVNFATPTLIERAAQAIRELPMVEAPRIRVEKRGIDLSEKGISTHIVRWRQEAVSANDAPLPDFIGYIQRQTELTRGTISEILIRSGRLDDVFVNAQQFLDRATNAVRGALHQMMVENIHYHLTGQEYELMRRTPQATSGFEKVVVIPLQKLVFVQKSIAPAIEVDSLTEAQFARDLDAREDVKFFLKFPRWFKVKTPLGNYNPDWAIVIETEDGLRLHLVCETKGSIEQFDLRQGEQLKMKCAASHFTSLGITYRPVTSAHEV